MFLSFSAGRSFYRANVDTMCSQAELAFIHVFKQELEKKITFVSYIGNRCEVEVIGKLQYTWWSVCLYHWLPFWGNIVITLIIFVFLFCLFKLKDGVSQVVLVEKEVIREVVSFVKEVGDTKPVLYSLNTDLFFNPKNNY